MKRHASALKRKRQSLKRHQRNRAILSNLKNLQKKLNVSLTNQKADETQLTLKKTVSAFDRAVSKGVVHHNTAARKISRLTLKVSKVLLSDKAS